MHHEALTNNGKGLLPRLGGFSNFYLAGGTALALQIGHRVSVDFDFFCQNDIQKSLLVKVEKVFAGKDVGVLVNNSGELTVSVAGVKITFLSYPFPVLSGFVNCGGIKLLGKKEIAATKAYTIGRRGSYKDYVDLFFLLNGHTTLHEIIELSEKKFSDKFNSRLFLEQLVYMDDVEQAEILFLKKAVSKEDILTFFESRIKSMRL